MADDTPIRVLAVSGSMGESSQTRTIADLALQGAAKAGAETKLLDLAVVDPPNLRVGDQRQGSLPSVLEVRATARWADGLVIATPEYHGGPSGVLKNWFDLLWPELAGKVAGVCATAGGRAADQSCAQVELYCRQLHCWTLPYNAQALARDFDRAGVLTDEKTRDRVLRLGRDVAVYAGVLRARFSLDTTLGTTPDAGFAAWHPR